MVSQSEPFLKSGNLETKELTIDFGDYVRRPPISLLISSIIGV